MSCSYACSLLAQGIKTGLRTSRGLFIFLEATAGMVQNRVISSSLPQNKLFDATRRFCFGPGLEVAIDPAEASAEDSAVVELWGVSVRTRLSEARGLGHW